MDGGSVGQTVLLCSTFSGCKNYSIIFIWIKQLNCSIFIVWDSKWGACAGLPNVNTAFDLVVHFPVIYLEILNMIGNGSDKMNGLSE
jgi:hypothetical protein